MRGSFDKIFSYESETFCSIGFISLTKVIESEQVKCVSTAPPLDHLLVVFASAVKYKFGK